MDARFAPNDPLYWILDHHTPRPARTLQEWADFYSKKHSRRVAETQVGDYWVSTVFLGIDHGFGFGVPILFETMVFQGRPGRLDATDLHSERYSTWDEAVEGHRKVVLMMELMPARG